MAEDFKPKKYYSLNLTEGRVLIIFIAVILLITIITFCITFLFFNKNKSHDMNLKNHQSDSNMIDMNSDENFSNYSINEDNKVKEEKIQISNESSGENKNFDIINSEKDLLTEKDANAFTDNKQDLKSEYNNLIEKNDSSANLVKVDNSEILYSSKFTNDSEKSVKKNSAVKTNLSVNKKTEVKKYDKNYIVQVGSFTKKSTAESISLFYKKQGYSSFIVTKTINDKTYYRLRVGPYKNKDLAEKNLAEIKKSKYGESSYISIVYI